MNPSLEPADNKKSAFSLWQMNFLYNICLQVYNLPPTPRSFRFSLATTMGNIFTRHLTTLMSLSPSWIYILHLSFRSNRYQPFCSKNCCNIALYLRNLKTSNKTIKKKVYVLRDCSAKPYFMKLGANEE